jgi:sortase A
MFSYRSLGALLIVAGLALVGVVAWTVADPLAGHRQHALQQELQHSWAAQNPISAARKHKPVPATEACTDNLGSLRPSQPFALMTIPAFGAHWKFAVVEGTTLTQLALGPGHITGTSMPGGANFGVAAHDITAGNPFLRLKSLKAGDDIYVRTANCLYDYQVTGQPFVVPYTDVNVLKPIAGKRSITLVTCTPVTLVFTPWRIIVHGALVSSVRWR